MSKNRTTSWRKWKNSHQEKYRKKYLRHSGYNDNPHKPRLCWQSVATVLSNLVCMTDNIVKVEDLRNNFGNVSRAEKLLTHTFKRESKDNSQLEKLEKQIAALTLKVNKLNNNQARSRRRQQRCTSNAKTTKRYTNYTDTTTNMATRLSNVKSCVVSKRIRKTNWFCRRPSRRQTFLFTLSIYCRQKKKTRLLIDTGVDVSVWPVDSFHKRHNKVNKKFS